MSNKNKATGLLYICIARHASTECKIAGFSSEIINTVKSPYKKTALLYVSWLYESHQKTVWIASLKIILGFAKATEEVVEENVGSHTEGSRTDSEAVQR